jgi:hypothetical protein
LKTASVDVIVVFSFLEVTEEERKRGEVLGAGGAQRTSPREKNKQCGRSFSFFYPDGKVF